MGDTPQPESLPPELIEAVDKCSLVPLRALRARLRGDEVIAVADTGPLFAHIILRMNQSDPATVEAIGALTADVQKMEASTRVRPLIGVIQIIEDLVMQSQDEHLKKLSPAAYVVSKLFKGERPETYDDLPAEVIPALQTRRPQLLSLAFARIREGRLFSHREVREIVRLSIDYTNTRFDPETINNHFPGGKVPVPALDDASPVTDALCFEALMLLETVLKDLDFNEQQGNGVYVPDGQGRSRSLMREIR